MQPAAASERAGERARRGTARPTSAIEAERFGYPEARHLLWRAGFGGTPEQIQTLASWGPERAVDYLLEVEEIPYEGEPDAGFRADIMRPYTPDERRQYARARRENNEGQLARLRQERQRRQRDDRRQMREAQRWWLTRMIESPRPLEEKMALFWHGHFATSYRTIEDSYHMVMQNELFRREAVGNYGELMFSIIRDPAMLEYLDNNDSRVGKPNENLARELMELFSLGVGNYTEEDIKEGARALTGYTFYDDEFRFQERNHDRGTKEILGRRGSLDGDDFVRAILEQKACSEFMVRKLYSYFARELPEDAGSDDAETRAVLRDLASTFRRAKYDVKPVLRRLFLSEDFYSDRVMGEMIKSPVELVVGAARSLLTPVRDLDTLIDAMGLMGQTLFMPPSVKGWPVGRAWVNTSTLFVRQNTLAFMLTGKRPEGYDASARTDPYDPEPLLGPLVEGDPAAARDAGRVADYLLRFALGRSPEGARETLVEFMEEHGGEARGPVVTGMLLLITSMPEYQLM